MDSLISGAGVFVAFSALPMLPGLLLRQGNLAALLRRIAITLAVILPILFMLLTAVIFLSQQNPNNTNVFFDYRVNLQAALTLYRDGATPYTVPAAYSFPFPTFFLYALLDGFGSLSFSTGWIVWWIVNGVIWLSCVVILLRTIPATKSNRERDVLRYLCVAIPAITTLWQGQTALFILSGLVLLHIGTLPGRGSGWQFLGGAGLAFAALIKPQLALVGAAPFLWGVMAFRQGNHENVRRATSILVSAAITGSSLIVLTLLLPGGVTLDTYRDFFTQALPQVARPADGVVIGSPAFMAAVIAYQAGLPANVENLAATGVTVIVAGLAIFWTLRRSDRSLAEITAVWGVVAMVAPRVAWTWYAAWCLPFFLLSAQESAKRNHYGRIAIMVIVLAIFNLQTTTLLIDFLAISMLIVLAWCSFTPPPS